MLLLSSIYAKSCQTSCSYIDYMPGLQSPVSVLVSPTDCSTFSLYTTMRIFFNVIALLSCAQVRDGYRNGDIDIIAVQQNIYL